MNEEPAATRRPRRHAYHRPWSPHHLGLMGAVILSGALYLRAALQHRHDRYNLAVLVLDLLALQLVLGITCCESSALDRLQVAADRPVFCSLCSLQVDRSTKHCSACDKCVFGFDHHCVWLNSCIGARHYRKFVWLCLLQAASLALKAAMLVYLLATRRGREPLAFLSASTQLAVDLPACCLLADLLAYHAYLRVKGLSTYEHIKQRRLQRLERAAGLHREDLASKHRPAPSEQAALGGPIEILPLPDAPAN